MNFDLGPILILAMIGLGAVVLAGIGLIVAVVTYICGYWSFGIVI